MEEPLVSLEIAKLLKNSGFNEEINTYWNKHKLSSFVGEFNKWNNSVCYISMPTQTIAMKWLREKKNIHISIYNNASGYGYEISKADNGTHISNSDLEGPNKGGMWDVYEDTVEAAIIESLNYIKC